MPEEGRLGSGVDIAESLESCLEDRPSGLGAAESNDAALILGLGFGDARGKGER